MTTIVFDDELTRYTTRRADKTGETVQAYVERIIRELVDPRPNVDVPIEIFTVDEMHRIAYGCYPEELPEEME